MSDSKTLTLARAINEGLRRSLENDPKVLLMGEDIGALGGVFRVTDGLQKDFGEDRVVDTPLAESGILGTAIGLALRGYRPVCEIQFDGFIFPAYDQITTQLAKMGYRSGGKLQVPVVIRVPYGGGIGAVEHHSESPEPLCARPAGGPRPRRRPWSSTRIWSAPRIVATRCATTITVERRVRGASAARKRASVA